MKQTHLPVAIVIPLYNEMEIVTGNLERLAGFFDRLIGERNWKFILVDNGSTDGTPELLKACVTRWPLSQVLLLKRPNYGAALRAGLRSATTRWVYLLDIEQWDFPFMEWAWRHRDRYELFIGSKRADPALNHQGVFRRLLSTTLNRILKVLFDFGGTDTHGPKLLDRHSLEAIIRACELDRGQFDTELVLRASRDRKRLIEVPVEYREFRPNRNWMIS